jgi:hypothetical protein
MSPSNLERNDESGAYTPAYESLCDIFDLESNCWDTCFILICIRGIMNPSSVHGYTSLDKTGKDAELDKTSLDILELFVVHREKYMWKNGI